MNQDVIKKSLGETGQAGVVALVAGLVILGLRDRKAAFGALVVVVGIALVGYGLGDRFLKSMGMEYEDLY